MYIKVKVLTSSKRESLIKKNKDTYIISVKEPAERNLANKRVCDIISINFEISVKKIRIISGHQSQNKILSINLGENLL